MRLIYVPIADSFFESSIMQEELAVRFVMLALIRLALRAGADGIVDVDMRTFAGSINIPLADVERAIKRLMEPDPASGCTDEGGRRIVPVDPDRPMRGWRLVTWKKHQRMVHDANAAARMRALREDRVPDVPDVPDVPNRSQPFPPVPTKTKTKTILKTPLTPRARGGPRRRDIAKFDRGLGAGVSAAAYKVKFRERFGVEPPTRTTRRG